MNTLIGQLLDEEGHAMQISKHVTRANHPGRNFDVETRASFRATPARNVRSRQAERIPVNIGHDPAAEIGEVVHLEMPERGRHLWAVAEIDYPLEGPWTFSVETTSTYERGTSIGTDIEITGLGVVGRSAQLNLAAITILPGGLDRRRSWQLPPLERTLVANAAEVLRDRRHNRPIQVRGLFDPYQQEAVWHARAAAEHGINMRPHGRLWHSRPVPNSIVSVR